MKVGIIGLGYVGLPLAVAFAETGNDVVGVDTDARRVERLRRSESDVEDIPSERLRAVAERFTATDEYRSLAACEAVVICVPTPLANHREPDLSYMVRLICDDVIEVSSPEVAELTKLLENIFRSVNIALVNELAQLCDRMGIDVWEVVDAAASKPFGFMRFDPGPGMGGHCLPVDPFYLAFKAREHDFYTEFIELAGKLNQAQPLFCVQKIERVLNDASKPVRGSRILLLGVAYKGGVGDLRESPALKIIRRLRDLGGDVVYHDPHVPQLTEFGLASTGLDEELGRAELVCVITAHPEIDYERVVATRAWCSTSAASRAE
jgi:UDP-N-acetyl-D-mannosaminuronate dehydrogenase